MFKSTKTLINFKSLLQYKNRLVSITNLNPNVLSVSKINNQRYYNYYNNNCYNNESFNPAIIYFMGWPVFYIISSFTNNDWEITGGKISGCIFWPVILVVIIILGGAGMVIWGLNTLFDGKYKKNKY